MKLFVTIYKNTAIFYLGVHTENVNLERRCFSFTWLGPSFNNESIFMNATCQDATRLSAGVPCVQPLVVSGELI